MPPADKAPKTFLCDEMLKGLARWLRAAGYDTMTCNTGLSDRALLELAIREQRLLLTRDRKLLEFRHAPGNVICLRCNALDDCVDELSTLLKFDWLYRPFSRCLLCNTELIAAAENLYSRIPASSRENAQEVLYCPSCDKLYWHGSHVRRMKRMLSVWAQRQGLRED